ncbi:Aerobic glycerol-3-phosphate dehydrogenase [plant metagenome]|uniref:Aerobic glycerol-3-phosphate dehydrogenase n=1 Tax=plant metagenome TaxID=1297885 RepID=A0A484Q344_9ZZZZ
MSDFLPPPPPDHHEVDLLVVGGGINGAGIARDATGRGLKVLLCERGDLAQATSSSSSKLVHGGLRYLENREFRLVREALAEREVLLTNAAHIVHPMRFVLPHDATLRPAWMLRTGLFLYDHLARRSPRLPGARRLDLRADPMGQPLRDDLRTGFAYSDCSVDDARLVVLNAMDAQARGAVILTRHECVAAQARDGAWQARLRGPEGQDVSVRARILVNAAGPWVQALQSLISTQAGAPPGPSRLKLVKGSHFTVPKLYDGEHAYILQNDDRRIIFVLPYQGEFSLIGTTDVAFEGDPGQAKISDEEIAYLCRAVNRYFKQQIGPADIAWRYAGVRPLYDDHPDDARLSTVTRDYVFDVAGGQDGQPVLLSIYGGKITTFRQLAQHAMEKLAPYTGKPEAWTASAPLPGSDMPGADPQAYLHALQERYRWLPAPLARRYVYTYGTLTEQLLAGAQSMEDLGEDFGAGLTEAEVRWLTRHEWARTAEDILWRRTRLGLLAPADAADRLDAWLAQASTADA